MKDNIYNISIAMATYNGQQFLAEQLDSIFAQSYQEYELVVSDDCSTDNTLEILQSYAAKHPNMKILVNEQNLQCVKNFEKAIRRCSGEYIALADQDDIWEPDKLETLLKEINGYSLIFSDAALIDEQDNLLHPSHVRYSGRATSARGLSYLIFSNIAQGSTTLFKRELLDYALPFGEEAVGQDWYLTVAAIYADGIRYIDRPLIRYRQHSSNVAGAGHKWRVLKLINIKRLNKTFERVQLAARWLLDSKIPLPEKDKKFIEKCLKYSRNYLRPAAVWFWFRVLLDRLLKKIF